jgi:hypothetical protein
MVLFGSNDPGNHVSGSDVRVVIGPVLPMTNPAWKGPWQTWVRKPKVHAAPTQTHPIPKSKNVSSEIKRVYTYLSNLKKQPVSVNV